MRVFANALLIRLGQRNGIATVALNVNSEDQVRQLEALGCDYAQGKLFYQSLSLTGFSNLLDS